MAAGLSATTLLGLTAVGANAAPAAPATNASCPATPGVTPTTVNVGIVFPKTVAGYAGFDAAAMLRFAQQNAKGGINGRKIVTATYDDGANPATQVTVANKAIQQDNMFSLISASTTDTMYPSLKAAGVPIVGLANSPAYTNDRNAFGNQGPWLPTISSTSLLQRFADDGATNIAFVNHNSPGAIASNTAAVATAPLIPVNVTLRINDLPIGTYDATSTVLRMKNAGVNGVYAVLLPEGGVSIGNAAKQQNLNIKTFYVPALTDPSTIAKAGAGVEGVFSAPYIGKPVGVNVPAVRTYANGLKAAGINPYLNFAPTGFISADETILGLQKAGKCPTRQSFIDGLRSVKSYDANGFLPNKFSYAPTSLSPLGGPVDVTKSCSWYVTVKNGQPVPDAKATCGRAIDTTTGKFLG
jgi:branched-chain amino acid transport system substrate-binding protein